MILRKPLSQAALAGAALAIISLAAASATAATQTPTTPSATDPKPAAPKAAAATAPAKKTVVAKATTRKTSKTAVAKPEPTPVEAPADEPETLTESQLAAAKRVMVGNVDCELGQKVSLQADEAQMGRFKLAFHNVVYHLTPQDTTTGAVRLEDRRNGIVWLQIPVKSMLMNNKLGQRMVDACQYPEQRAFAEALVAANQINGTTPAAVSAPVAVASPAVAAPEATAAVAATAVPISETVPNTGAVPPPTAKVP